MVLKKIGFINCGLIRRRLLYTTPCFQTRICVSNEPERASQERPELSNSKWLCIPDSSSETGAEIATHRWVWENIVFVNSENKHCTRQTRSILHLLFEQCERVYCQTGALSSFIEQLRSASFHSVQTISSYTDISRDIFSTLEEMERYYRFRSKSISRWR